MGGSLKPFKYASFVPNTPSIGGTLATSDNHAHLSFGFPDSKLFPIEQLNIAASKAILEQGRKALHYSGGPGISKVTNWIVERVKLRAIQAQNENVIVTAGAGQAIDIVARVLINPEDEVWVEAPTFFSAIRSFELCGATIKAFEVDENGIRIDLIEAAIQEAQANQKPLPKLLYVMPNFHNPAGVVLSLERRKKLAELALQYNFYILEDDAYVDLNFKKIHIPSIYSFAPERVINVGTFSKIIGPGIRLGWAIANTEILAKLNILKLGSQTNPFMQEILANLLDELSFEEYLEGLITNYCTKRDVIVESIHQHFGNQVTFNVPEGGFFILIEFDKNIDTAAFIPIAFEKGVSVVAGTEFYVDGRGKNEIRLCFTFPSEEQIRNGIERLAKAYFEHITVKI